MTLEMMKELFGIAHVRDDEEEVPNTKRKHVGEEEVSLSQSVTTAVLSEEEEVLVPQGLCSLLLEEEDIPVSLLCPPVTVPPEEEVPQGPIVTVMPEEEVPLEKEEVPVP
jgi:hypothetical protein